jgi:hypothetical protein
MSTWKCLYYALVCCLGSHTLKWLVGVFIASPHNYSRWIEAAAFCRRAHRTVRCTPDMHCSLSDALATSADRWIRPLPKLFGAHQTVWCYSPRAPVVGLSTQTVLVSHRTVRCTPDRYCSLSGAPPVRWLSNLFLDFFADSLAFFCSWVLDF